MRRKTQKAVVLLIAVIAIVSLPSAAGAIGGASQLVKEACIAKGGQRLACELFEYHLAREGLSMLQEVGKTCVSLCPQLWSPVEREQCVKTCNDLSR